MSFFQRLYTTNLLIHSLQKISFGLPIFQRHFHCSLTLRLMEVAPGPVQLLIEKKLKENFLPVHLEVVNESYKHAVPKGSESHFKVVVVSTSFEGKSLIQRHRSINELLTTELEQSIHALSIQAKTPSQWDASGHAVADTPPCLGGSQAERRH